MSASLEAKFLVHHVCDRYKNPGFQTSSHNKAKYYAIIEECAGHSCTYFIQQTIQQYSLLKGHLYNSSLPQQHIVVKPDFLLITIILYNNERHSLATMYSGYTMTGVKSDIDNHTNDCSHTKISGNQ